mmetsp:Transcript_44567/g.139767  ORF Transcript_44567/g.139767 Transcript_44567/m.139767 type:complete len:81 (+) Transcript_44567:122-364(+)
MTHVHLRGSAADLRAACAKAAEATGVELFYRLRGESYLDGADGWTYYEWSMGPDNMQISPRDAEAAWAAFFEHLAAGGEP